MDGNGALDRWLAQAWATAAETFEVPVEGITIRCRGWNMQAHDLPGIILVHGFRAHARWWDHIAPSLTSHHRVVAINLGGMGDSDARDTYARAQFGREILAVAAAVGFDPVTIIAHSFGSMGSLIASIAAPEKVRRIIVIDSAIPAKEDVGHQIATPPRRLYPDKETAISRFRLIPPGEWPIPAVLAYIAEHSVKEGPEGWSWKFDENAAPSLNQELFRDSMFGVPVPVDMIYGDHTEVMHPARRQQLREMAPLCGQEIAIPAAHHHIMIEQPMALVAAIRALLANPRD